MEISGPSSESLYATMVRVENKDIFVDLKRNRNGVYLKISERSGSGRNTVLIPSSGIQRLKTILDEVSKLSDASGNVVSRERKQRIASDPEVTARSVYVTGLAWETTDEELAAHYAQVGTVTKATILRLHRRGTTKNSMGCGIVEFQSPETALVAVTTLAESELGGRKIRCREDRNPEDFNGDEYSPTDGHENTFGKPKTSYINSMPIENRELDPNRVFVSSLAWETTKEELASFFSAAGQVISAEVLTTKKGRSMGSGIIEFSDEASAIKSIDMFTDVMLNGRAIAVRKCYK